MKNLFNYIKLYPLFFNRRSFSEAAFFLTRGRTRAPFSVNFQITDKCNLRCKACSFFSEGRVVRPASGEADFESLRKFLITISKYNPVVSFGGGEPFARSDFLEILKTAKKECGLRTVVITNGTLFSDAAINTIVKLKLIDYLVVSVHNLYGKHDEIVGKEGAFEAVLGNIRKFTALRGIDLIVSTVLMEENARDLENLAGFFLGEGVKKIKIEHQNFLTGSEYGALDKNSDFCPGTFVKKAPFGDSFIRDAWDSLERIKEKYPQVIIKPGLSRDEFYRWYGEGAFSGPGIRAGAGKCHFTKHSFFVDPQGKIIPCQYFNKCVLGKIGEDDPYFLWGSAGYRKTRKAIERGSFAMCSRCCK